ncbi:hypothetical protein [Streptomyces mexicanus]|uniref:hypothetical protein n=1 Tax=Streptomyces mexicanus TaxID=178566 RepID=UPI0031E681FB
MLLRQVFDVSTRQHGSLLKTLRDHDPDFVLDGALAECDTLRPDAWAAAHPQELLDRLSWQTGAARRSRR